MYFRIGNLEILDSYLSSIEVGDMISAEALVRNPLDWHHFYENITSLKSGDITHFTVVTNSGERISGMGSITEIDKWSNKGQFGFKIKLRTNKRKLPSTKRLQPSANEIIYKNLERSMEVAAR